MSRELNPMQVWSQVPLANRTITVSDKTGFSLTAGSYSVRASSTQRAEVNVAGAAQSQTSAISSVTLTRATAVFGGSMTSNNDVTYLCEVQFTSSTVITAKRRATTDNSWATYEIMEFF